MIAGKLFITAMVTMLVFFYLFRKASQIKTGSPGKNFLEDFTAIVTGISAVVVFFDFLYMIWSA